MRTARLVLLVLTATAAAAGATPNPPPRVETIDRGDAIEVIARGAIAADAAKVSVVRERVEIPLANDVPSTRRIVEDATALLVEIRGDAPRVLSVKLHRDHAGVVAIAPAVTYTQVGDELHVVIPRALPKAVEPIAPATEEPAAAAPAPAAEPTTAPAAPAPTPRALVLTAGTTTTAPAPAAPAPAPLAKIAGASSPNATGGRWWMMLGGLALVAAGITVALRRKRNPEVPINELEIIATRSVGGKARIVWLAAGDQEIVVAISPQQIRPLAQWQRKAGVAAGERSRPIDRSFGRAFEEAAAPALRSVEPNPTRGSGPLPRMRTVTANGTSPALAGLMRLRDRTPVPPSSSIETIENEFDDDGQWSRDVVTNTGGRR